MLDLHWLYDKVLFIDQDNLEKLSHPTFRHKLDRALFQLSILGFNLSLTDFLLGISAHDKGHSSGFWKERG